MENSTPRAVWLAFALASTLCAADFKPTAQDSVVAANAKWEMVWTGGEFTEGPAAAANGDIYFSDIGNRVLRFTPSSAKTTVVREPSGRANGLEFDAGGRLIACEGAYGGGRRIAVIDGNTSRTLADRWEGKRFNSPNDLTVAPGGIIYFTDPRYLGDEPRDLDFEGVFLVRPNGTVALATRDVQKPNGIAARADGKVIYVADNNPKGNRHLLEFTVQADGTLAGKKVLHDFGPNRRGIDGMTLDLQGTLFATAGTGNEAGIYVFTPSGVHVAFVPTQGTPTNCTFGTGRESGVLYVTAQSGVEVGGRKPWGLYRMRLKAP